MAMGLCVQEGLVKLTKDLANYMKNDTFLMFSEVSAMADEVDVCWTNSCDR